jgi:hypothetical protein
MVKLVVLALSVSAATLAGSYAQKQFAAATLGVAGETGHAKEGSSSVLTETDLLVLPVIANGELAGFSFLRLAYTANPASSSFPPDLLLSDGFYQFAVKAPVSGQNGFGEVNVDEVAEGVKLAVNAVAGKPVISDIFVTQIDFFASADVRKKSIERRLVLKEEPAKETHADDSHSAPAEAEHAPPAH